MPPIDDPNAPPQNPPVNLPPNQPAPPVNTQVPANPPPNNQPAGQPGESVIVADLRAEAAARRVEAREAKVSLAETQAALATAQTQSAAERADIQRQADAARSIADRAKERTLKAELKAAATAAGIADQDFIDLIPRDKITIDDELNIVGLDTAITEFKTRKPALFRSAEAPQTPPRPTGSLSAPPPNPGSAHGSAVKDLPPADYKAQKAGALKSLRGR